VDARTKEGGSRRFFTTKTEAQTFAQQCRIHRDEHGTAAFGNAELAQYGKTVRDAIDFYLAHLRQQERSIPIAEALAELVAMRKAAGKSQRYCRDLELRLGRFERDFHARSIASFTAKELDEWLTGLPVAPGTRNTFRRDLRTLFSFCEKRGYCAGNEAKKTERARDIDKPAGILSVAQAAALLGACGDDTLPVVAISLFAGLRSAEVQKLDWGEIDLDGGHIEVTAAKSKTARRRLVPISDNLAAFLRPLVQPAGPVAPVGLRKRFDAAKAHAGLKKWPQNAMRHSYGSYRLAACHDAARVSLEMGNSAQMVFAHYRELVKPKDAARFWKIVPAANDGKVVAMAAA
jgi:integrase